MHISYQWSYHKCYHCPYQVPMRKVCEFLFLVSDVLSDNRHRVYSKAFGIVRPAKIHFLRNLTIHIRVFFVPNRPSLRTKRRLSINPLPSIRVNSKLIMASDYDGQSMMSNQASVNSNTSLASLLKEKMQVYMATLYYLCY